MTTKVRTTPLQILVYRCDRLAADFACGAPPWYHGEADDRVRALVETDRLRYNPWVLEVHDSRLYHDREERFLASVLLGSRLARAGFRVLSRGGSAGSARCWPG